MPTEQEQQVLSDLRRGLQALYGDRLVKLILFGSRARGDARADSDYDVMVVLRGPMDPYKEIERASYVKSAVCIDHEAVITCIYVSEDELDQDGSLLFRNVRGEGVEV